MWEWRSVCVHDLRRAASISTHGIHEPQHNFIVRPSFTTVMEVLHDLQLRAEKGRLRLACDIETRARHIACFGLAWSNCDSICIPFMDVHQHPGYWSIDEEAAIILRLHALTTHPNVEVVGQNWMYDMQYIARHWGFCPWPYFDTMLAQHTCFPGMPKSLGFIASLHCEYYVYWKEEGKQWDPRYVDEEQLWVYNCKDCVNTFEASYSLESAIHAYHLEEPFKFQMKMVKNVMITMLRGVKVDMQRRKEISTYLLEAMLARQQYLNFILDMDFNPRSAPQMKKLFYNVFGVKPTLHKKTKKPTLNKNALGDLRKKADAILYPVIDAIIEFRRAGTANSVATVDLDRDLRFRTSYNLAGTETFRLASSEDAFGFGTNGQNISTGDEK
jgi:DNA polymerase I-like protein with 3'-5' exonuclease and polymerase domains